MEKETKIAIYDFCVHNPRPQATWVVAGLAQLTVTRENGRDGVTRAEAKFAMSCLAVEAWYRVQTTQRCTTGRTADRALSSQYCRRNTLRVRCGPPCSARRCAFSKIRSINGCHRRMTG